MKIGFVVDIKGWAAYWAYSNLVKYNTTEHTLELINLSSCKGNSLARKVKSCDLVVCYLEINYPCISSVCKMCGVPSIPHVASFFVFEFPVVLQSFKGVFVVLSGSEEMVKELKKVGIESVYLPVGIDTEIFYSTRLPFSSNSKLTFGWVGSSASEEHIRVKGYQSIIKPYFEEHPEYTLKVCGRPNEVLIETREGMNEFYNSIDVYLSMSQSEVIHTVVLEAMATGRVVACTRTGVPLELIEDGVNGFFVNERSMSGIDKFVGRLKEFSTAELQEIGRRARETIVQRYNAAILVPEFIERVVGLRGMV